MTGRWKTIWLLPGIFLCCDDDFVEVVNLPPHRALWSRVLAPHGGAGHRSMTTCWRSWLSTYSDECLWTPGKAFATWVRACPNHKYFCSNTTSGAASCMCPSIVLWHCFRIYCRRQCTQRKWGIRRGSVSSATMLSRLTDRTSANPTRSSEESAKVQLRFRRWWRSCKALAPRGQVLTWTPSWGRKIWQSRKLGSGGKGACLVNFMYFGQCARAGCSNEHGPVHDVSAGKIRPCATWHSRTTDPPHNPREPVYVP